MVIDLVNRHGPRKWAYIAKHLKGIFFILYSLYYYTNLYIFIIQIEGRIGKQCRERWHNHLNPAIKKTDWTIDEDWIIHMARRKVTFFLFYNGFFHLKSHNSEMYFTGGKQMGRNFDSNRRAH